MVLLLILELHLCACFIFVIVESGTAALFTHAFATGLVFVRVPQCTSTFVTSWVHDSVRTSLNLSMTSHHYLRLTHHNCTHWLVWHHAWHSWRHHSWNSVRLISWYSMWLVSGHWLSWWWVITWSHTWHWVTLLWVSHWRSHSHWLTWHAHRRLAWHSHWWYTWWWIVTWSSWWWILALHLYFKL